jgi:hypothetical protein
LTSVVLGVEVYDTQCGAKLFRNNLLLKEIFSESFRTKWIFDVEILARYLAKNENQFKKQNTQAIIELPLDSWIHVPGSKLRVTDFVVSGMDLFRIWLTYHKSLKRT